MKKEPAPTKSPRASSSSSKKPHVATGTKKQPASLAKKSFSAHKSPSSSSTTAPASKKRTLPTKFSKGNNNSNNSAEQIQKKLRITAEMNRDARNELVLRMNKIWNDLRAHELDPEKQVALCQELANALKGKVFSFSQRPDTSRVLQTLFKLGAPSIRQMIVEELLPHVLELCKGKYSSFLFLSLLRNCKDAKERSRLVSEIRTQVRVLSAHAHGARIVNYCLCGGEEVLSPMERQRFFENLYGGASLTKLNSLGNWQLVHYLPQDNVLKATQLVQPLKKLLLKICEKGLLRFPFAQVLLWELLSNLKDRDEICLFVPSVVEASLVMVGTWEGAQSVALVLDCAESKDRKKIVKEWKGHVLDLCTHKFGWFVVLSFLRVMDDTKFSNKTIWGELFDASADENQMLAMLMQEEGFGRKVFLYVLCGDVATSALPLAPRDGKDTFTCLLCQDNLPVSEDHIKDKHAPLVSSFSKSKRLRTYFEDFDTLLLHPHALSTSKKDPLQRNEEVVQELSQSLSQLMLRTAEANNQGEIATLLTNKRSTDVIREWFLRQPPSNEKVTLLVAQQGAKVLDDAHGHLTVKRMIQDETQTSQGSFAKCLAESLSMKDLLGKGAAAADNLNRTCFVVNALAEHPSVGAQIKREVKPLLAKLKPCKGVEALKKTCL